jgi:hypothetical protein
VTRPLIAMLLCLMASALAPHISVAQEIQQTLRVGITEVPPFVIQEADGSWSGISIELWQQIAERNGYRYELLPMPFDRLLPELESRQLDAVVGALTMTAEREELIDFTHPLLSHRPGDRTAGTEQRRLGRFAGIVLLAGSEPGGRSGRAAPAGGRSTVVVRTPTQQRTVRRIVRARRRQRLLVGGGDHDHCRLWRQGAGHPWRASDRDHLDVRRTDHGVDLYRGGDDYFDGRQSARRSARPGRSETCSRGDRRRHGQRGLSGQPADSRQPIS